MRGGDGALLLALAALLALLFVVREATNLGTARAAAETERDRLSRAIQLQEELIYLITHEVKNPLTMVRAYAQLGQSDVARRSYERLPEFLGNVDRGGAAIERLVENLLQLSRLEQSDSLPPSEVVDLPGLARDVVADLEPLAHQKQQQIQIEVAAERPPPALAPSALLREALSNLVSNAIKYTPKGGSITVWVRESDAPGTVHLGVTDSGIGLSDEDKAKLFTRFFRSANPQARQERGSGLGLALTHAIVERMGGRIVVSSTLGQGTTFQLVLPSTPER
jgi:signal transduction histidine kinase